MPPKNVLDPAFQYDKATETAKPGYLADKWNRLYPGWNKKPPKPPKKVEVETKSEEKPPILRLLTRRS